MDWPQIIGSLAVLIVAFIAYVRSSAALRTAEAARLDASRRASAVEADLRQEIDLLRRFVSKMSAGDTLTPEMIDEGQLWRDVDGRRPPHSLRRTRTSRSSTCAHPPRQRVASSQVQRSFRWTSSTSAAMRSLRTDVRSWCTALLAAARPPFAKRSRAFGTDNLYNLNGGFGAWPGETTKAHPS